MGYWIFKCDPEVYRLEDRLADPNPRTTWKVSRYRDKIQSGDTIFIWKNGKDRGIRAVIKATAEPADLRELENEQPYLAERDTGVECRVLADITHRNVNVSADKLSEAKGLENLSVFHGYRQGTNFPVTPAEGKIIERLINSAG